MGLLEIILISIGVAMDAFAVAICKGLSFKKMDYKKALIVGVYFGAFQALMPLLGYLLGETFESFITQIDHWVAFILLALIGLTMIVETFNKEKEEHDDKIDFKNMILLSIATSIDALAVGITFALFPVNIFFIILLTGTITFALSFIGVKLGNKFGNKYENIAKIVGGIVLILIGTKILLEHLSIIG